LGGCLVAELAFGQEESMKHATAEFKICPTQSPKPWDDIPVLVYWDYAGESWSDLSGQASARAQQIAEALEFFDGCQVRNHFVRWNWKGSQQGYYFQSKSKR
jgi:hypothetical protein